jgi:hypothetical protein
VRYRHQWSDGNVSCCSVSDPGPVPFGRWTHVASTYSGGTVRVYVNGALVGSISEQPPPLPDTGSLLLGQISFIENTRNLRGLLDEVRIWNVARTPAEIGQSYNRFVSPTAAGLVGYWKFDEPAGTPTAADATGNANHGTLSGGPLRVASTVPIKQ